MKKRFWVGLLVIVLAVSGLFAVVQAQTNVRTQTQQWEYALLIWDITEGTYTYRTSVIYETMNFELAIGHETTQALFDALDGVDDSALIDYLGAMGVSGYELVDVTNLSTSVLYTFKRPQKQ